MADNINTNASGVNEIQVPDNINSFANSAKPGNSICFRGGINVHGVKVEKSQYNNIEDALSNFSIKDGSTILFNDFSSDLDAYYFSSSSVFSDNKCSIYRKTYSQPYFDYVCTLDNAIAIVDYNIHNKDYYDYMAIVSVPRSDGGYTYLRYENKDINNEKIYAHTEWSDWSIVNIEETDQENTYTVTGKVWKLGLNLQSESITQNLATTRWDTLGKYSKTSIGVRDYMSGTVTCLLGTMAEVTIGDLKSYSYTERENQNNVYSKNEANNGYYKKFTDTSYSRESEKFTAWQEFCSDGELKLLKDTKGNAWIVQIMDSPSYDFGVTYNGIPTTITFNWAEAMSLDGITIYKAGGVT